MCRNSERESIVAIGKPRSPERNRLRVLLSMPVSRAISAGRMPHSRMMSRSCSLNVEDDLDMTEQSAGMLTLRQPLFGRMLGVRRPNLGYPPDSELTELTNHESVGFVGFVGFVGGQSFTAQIAHLGFTKYCRAERVAVGTSQTMSQS